MIDRPRSFDVVTLPYPGLPTDLQPQAIALLAVADGTAMITENLFEARFMFCDEIARMGADVRTDGHHAVVRGKDLSSAPVRATDIRAGVGLVLAGLVAEGVTEIAEVHHIDRGYVRFEEQLRRSAPTSCAPSPTRSGASVPSYPPDGHTDAHQVSGLVDMPGAFPGGGHSRVRPARTGLGRWVRWLGFIGAVAIAEPDRSTNRRLVAIFVGVRPRRPASCRPGRC